MPQGGMTAVEIVPMTFDPGYSVNVPVSRIGNNLTENVADDGTITKNLAERFFVVLPSSRCCRSYSQCLQYERAITIQYRSVSVSGFNGIIG